jgi:hypothetical protein
MPQREKGDLFYRSQMERTGLSLRKAGIRAEKAFVGRRPKTTYHLTKKERAALTHYLDTLQRLLVAMGRTSSVS